MKLRYGSVFLLCLVAACAGDPAQPGRPGEPLEPVRALTSQEQRVADASVKFGLDLLSRVNPAETTKQNFLLSPFSASMALGMTLNGAVGPTFDAMKRTLGFGAVADAEVNAAYRGLLAQLRARGPKIEMATANSLWYERTFPVKQSFVDAVRENFDAEVAGLNFTDPAAARTISQWAEQKTNGRIRNLIEKIDPLEKLFLVNAVYFKAGWAAPFDRKLTRDEPFLTLNGPAVQVPMMNRDGVVRLYQDNAVKAVELLYSDTLYSMVVVGPADAISTNNIGGMLTPAKWQAILDGMYATRAMLSLPKFKFEYGRLLNDPLSDLGMRIAFTPFQADFTRIADMNDLHISRVQQKAFIDVNEVGTEAAAATAVGMMPTSLPPQLRFDRPFFFAIRERSSGTLLFIARIGNPLES